MTKLVEFTGTETEVEFLKKGVEQWEKTLKRGAHEVIMVMELGNVFNEMRHRIKELEGG